MRLTRLTLACLFVSLTLVLAAGASSPAMAKATPNLIHNPGAEDGSPGVVIPSWIQNAADQGSVISYGDSGTSLLMPGPANRGTQLWYGGVNTGEPDLHQSIDISKYVDSIKAGGVKFAFSGYFGGFGNNDDTSSGVVTFKNANGLALKSADIGNPTAADRANVSEMLLFSANGKIPPKTRKVTVDLFLTYHDGGSNDSYADNLLLKFSNL